MHPHAEQLQAAFATQRVIDGQNHRGVGCHETVDNQRQKLTRDLACSVCAGQGQLI